MATGGGRLIHSLTNEAKVDTIPESELCPQGYCSQKELSVVSKNKVWALTKGYIGSNQSDCAIFIRDKAVAPKHAEVRTTDPTMRTDGYWLSAATDKSSTNLLLSAERGVRTRTVLQVGSILKVGAEVQLELMRVEHKTLYNPVRTKGPSGSRSHYHKSVSDMFGAAEKAARRTMRPTYDDAEKTALFGTTAFGMSSGGLVEEEGTSGDGARGAGGRSDTESRKDARVAALQKHKEFSSGPPVAKSSHDRHVRFDKALFQGGGSRDIGPSMYQRSESERRQVDRDLLHHSHHLMGSFLRDHSRAPRYVAVFTIVAGPQMGEMVVASSRDGSIVIGSDPTCDLVVTGADVSPVHARLSFDDKQDSNSGGDGFGQVSAEQRMLRGKDVGAMPVTAGGSGGEGATALPGAVAEPTTIVVKPAPRSDRALSSCWVQDLAIGNRHGTQVAVTSESPVSLQRGDIIVLCKQLLLQPPEGTWVGTAKQEGATGDADGVAHGLVGRGGVTVAPTSGGAGAGKKSQVPFDLADRVELAILFHSETSAPPSAWAKLALRITRTRRSRRKSLHRSSTDRFPSDCVSIGPQGAVIGRSPKCDILIDDLTAANFHTQIVHVQDGYVLQTIAHPDFFGTFILLGRSSSPHDRYHHESKGLYQLEMNDIFKCGSTEFFVEEIKTETFFELKRRQTALKARVKLLSKSPLFSLLPDLDLSRIANAATKVHAMPGDVLMQEGDEVNKDACFFFIEKGDVAVSIKKRSKDGSGSEVISELGPGQCFGEMAMLVADRPRAATITAKSDLSCYALDWQSSKELLGPVMSAAMSLIAEKRETAIRMQLVAHLFPDVAETFAPDQLKLLAEIVQPVTFDAGTVIVSKGAECDVVFFIVGGAADIDAGSRGSLPDIGADETDLEAAMHGSGAVAKHTAAESVLDEQLKEGKGLLPGTAVGDVALLLNILHPATIVASQPCACLTLAKDAYNSLKNPLAGWLLRRWGHLEAVTKALHHFAAKQQRVSKGSINLAELGKKRSTVDLGLNEGHGAEGVLQVAAAQHARSRAEKWRKATAIRSSENSLVSLGSSRDITGDDVEVTETIADINSSLTDLVTSDDDDSEFGGSTRISATTAGEAAGAASAGDKARQSLPPDIAWGKGNPVPVKAGDTKKHRRRSLASVPSFTAVDTSKASVFGSLHAGESKSGSMDDDFPSVPPPIKKDDVVKGAAESKGGDGSGEEDAEAVDLDAPDGKGLVITNESLEEGTEGDGSSGAAKGSKGKRRKVKYSPRMRIPISSTNPTVEEVKMLAQIPRFLILRALTGPNRGTYFYITSDVTTMGNLDGDATIQLPDRTMSPAHSCIEYQDGAFWLRDLQSSTGTFLKLAAGKDYTMEMGDVFTIGHVELMVLGKPDRPTDTPATAGGKSTCCSVL